MPTKIETEKIPILIWGDQSDIDAQGEDCLRQARNLANHPIAAQHVALMPDFHLGYGMPVGGVFAARGGVLPNAVGVDIGCGMIAVKTTLEAESLSRDTLEKIRNAIRFRVPVGIGPGGRHKDQQDLWENTVPNIPVVDINWLSAHHQIGTLGSGNHFIEIQTDNEGHVWLMIHSGSRNLGKAVCDYFDRIAVDQCKGIDIPTDEGKKRTELAFLREGTPEFEQYILAMQWCMKFAEESRERMLNATLSSMTYVLNGWKWDMDMAIQTHHNYANLEEHEGELVWVHRKGAVKAEGQVIIPGSMGTASYIGLGLNSEDSFGTCSHGAGRVMGRKQANRTITHEQAVEAMKDVVYGVRQGDYDEMPQAYKDVHKVMANQADLVAPLDVLKPLAVVKG